MTNKGNLNYMIELRYCEHWTNIPVEGADFIIIDTKNPSVIMADAILSEVLDKFIKEYGDEDGNIQDLITEDFLIEYILKTLKSWGYPEDSFIVYTRRKYETIK